MSMVGPTPVRFLLEGSLMFYIQVILWNTIIWLASFRETSSKFESNFVLMMRVLVICLQFVMLVVAQEFYDRRYDYFDVDALIHNRRLLSRYLLCFLDKGPCPPIGKIFKNLLPEVVMTKCAKCSPRQKIFAKKVITAFDKNLPEDYEKLKKKLDPENKYFQAFEESLASI